jgi:flagellin
VEFKHLGISITVNENLGAAAIAANNTFDVDANNALTLQIGANNDANERMSIDNIGDMRSAALVVNALSVDTVTDAQNALTLIDNAINSVSATRGTFGAFQNRLEHTINNLAVAQENLAASESRIRDADVAREMANLTRAQILQQAAQGMLSQANMGAQGALSLLRG